MTTTRTVINNNNDKQNVVNPFFVGVFIVVASMVIRQFLTNNYYHDDGWTTNTNDNENPMATSSNHQRQAPPLPPVDPLEAVEKEWNHIETSKSNGGLQIFNSFVQDKDILTRLANKTLWEECNDRPTQWMDKTHQNDELNLWQKLAIDIWSSTEHDFVGYEYWCNILSTTKGLAWHVDKDEGLYESQEVLAHPVMGAVLYGYPHHDLMGGYLEILPADATEMEIETAPEAIRPEYNRLVILNVSKWHRVNEIENGKRYTFAVNIWDHKPSGF